jgi:hypothetical protein
MPTDLDDDGRYEFDENGWLDYDDVVSPHEPVASADRRERDRADRRGRDRVDRHGNPKKARQSAGSASAPTAASSWCSR